MNNVNSLTVVPDNLQLLDWLSLQCPAVPLAQLQKAVREGQIKADGRIVRQAAWPVPAGTQISWDRAPSDFFLQSDLTMAPLAVLYEDTDLLICNKPAGLLSHPSPQEKATTLLHAAAQYILQTGGPLARRPFLLHRLDRDTSGVIVLARSERAAQILNRDFQEKRVRKCYLALVKGVVSEDSGLIDAPIAPTPHLWPRWRIAANGAPAQTRFTVAQRFPQHTLLQLEPLTGRTHQLRIHCAHLGYPIAGEKIYRGTAKPVRAPGLSFARSLLHAERLTLTHPTQADRLLEITAPLPSDFAQALTTLADRAQPPAAV